MISCPLRYHNSVTSYTLQQADMHILVTQEAGIATWETVHGQNSPLKPGAAYNLADFVNKVSIG